MKRLGAVKIEVPPGVQLAAKVLQERRKPRGYRRPCSYCTKKTRLETVVKTDFFPSMPYWVACCRNCYLASVGKPIPHPAAPLGLVGRP